MIHHSDYWIFWYWISWVELISDFRIHNPKLPWQFSNWIKIYECSLFSWQYSIFYSRHTSTTMHTKMCKIIANSSDFCWSFFCYTLEDLLESYKIILRFSVKCGVSIGQLNSLESLWLDGQLTICSHICMIMCSDFATSFSWIPEFLKIVICNYFLMINLKENAPLKIPPENPPWPWKFAERPCVGRNFRGDFS